MGFQNIENKSLAYSLLKAWAKWWHNKVFYRKVIVLHPENIPADGHLLFTPNHQNALMDALGPLFTIPRQLVFLARADIFGKPLQSRILYFIKIMPVFRIRDGYDAVKKNDFIFRKTIDVIKAGNGLVILPEGEHAGIHKLRQLKKGFARIAFQAEEENDFSLNLKIVPIGLYYSDYENFRSLLLVNFGKPISVSKYIDLYKSNPALGIARLKDDLHEAMRHLMIDIESERFYSLYNHIRLYRAAQLRKQGKNETEQFEAQQEIVRKLENIEKNDPEQLKYLDKLVVQFEAQMKRFHSNFDTFALETPSVFGLLGNLLLLLAGSPFFVYGYLNNFLPWQLTNSYARRVKDPQFRSSFRYVLSLFLFPAFYILQSVFFLILVNEKWYVLAYFLSLSLSAAISWRYFQFFKKIRRKWKLVHLKLFNQAEFNNLSELYQKINNAVTNLL